MTVAGTYVANLLDVIGIIALLPLMLTVTVTPAPTLPSSVTLYLPHAPVNIRFVSIRPLSLSLSLSLSFPPFLSHLFPIPFALSLSLPLCLFVRHLQGVARRTHKLAVHLRRWGASKHAISQPISPANLLASSEEACKKQSESLANRPARSQANNYPPDQPAGQSNNQSAIRMPFKHIFLPAMRLSPSRFLSLSLSLPSPPASLSLSLSPSLSDCQTAAGCGTADT